MQSIDWEGLRAEHQAAVKAYDDALTIVESRLRAHARPTVAETLDEQTARARLSDARLALRNALMNEH